MGLLAAWRCSALHGVARRLCNHPGVKRWDTFAQVRSSRGKKTGYFCLGSKFKRQIQGVVRHMYMSNSFVNAPSSNNYCEPRIGLFEKHCERVPGWLSLKPGLP